MGATVNVQTNVSVDLGAAVRELAAIVGPKPSAKALTQASNPSPMVSDLARRLAKETLYLVSPSAWCRRELKLVLDGWQGQMVDAPAGSRVIALVHRQAGKTTAGAVGVRPHDDKAAAGLDEPRARANATSIGRTHSQGADGAHGQRRAAGGRQRLLGGAGQWIAVPGAARGRRRRDPGVVDRRRPCVDEAARVADALYEAARPMMIRHAATARLILLSTAWAKLGFFYKIWTDGDPQDWTKIEAKRRGVPAHLGGGPRARAPLDVAGGVRPRIREPVRQRRAAILRHGRDRQRVRRRRVVAPAAGWRPRPGRRRRARVQEVRMTYDSSRPETWSTFAASGFFLGLDVGLMQDHSALVLAGVWPQAGNAIGVIDIRQFPLGTALEDVADEAARLAREHTAGIVFDASNNSAFAGVLAARVPPPAVNWITAAVITNASGHAAQPTPMPLALGGLRSAIRRWTLSKSRTRRDDFGGAGQPDLADRQEGRLGNPAGRASSYGAHRQGVGLGDLFSAARQA